MTGDPSPMFLSSRHVNRSAEAVRTAERTTVYLGTCQPCNRPVRAELGQDHGPRATFGCVDCGQPVRGDRLAAVTTTLVCDGSCMTARRKVCGCGCGGANHGRVWGLKLGTSLVLDQALDAYRTQQAQLAREREERQERRRQAARSEAEAQRAEHPEVFAWLATVDQLTERSQFAADMALKASRGEVLPERVIEICEKISQERAEQAAAEAAAKPVPTGKGLEIAGEVVSTRVRDGYMGRGEHKMLVRHADGWRVWSTVPRDLLASADHLDELQGQRVRFTADVTASQDDPAFGYAARPRKAQRETEA